MASPDRRSVFAWQPWRGSLVVPHGPQFKAKFLHAMAQDANLTLISTRGASHRNAIGGRKEFLDFLMAENVTRLEVLQTRIQLRAFPTCKELTDTNSGGRDTRYNGKSYGSGGCGSYGRNGRDR